MRHYWCEIEEAELLASSPERVAKAFKDLSAKKVGYLDYYPIDDHAQIALRERNDPLITLTLARYSCWINVLKPIFKSSQRGDVVRLAILSNQWLAESDYHFPNSLFDDDKEAAEWFSALSDQEAEALFKNLCLPVDFMENVIRAKAPWDGISEDSLRRYITIFGISPKTYDRNRGKGKCSEYSFATAAWSLARAVPVGAQWAETLSILYGMVGDPPSDFEEPLKVMTRWTEQPSETPLSSGGADTPHNGALNEYQNIRIRLARLALEKDDALLVEMLVSKDKALRFAAYEVGKLSKKQIRNGAHGIDFIHFFDHIKLNGNAWNSKTLAGELLAAANRNPVKIEEYYIIRETRAEWHQGWKKPNGLVGFLMQYLDGCLNSIHVFNNLGKVLGTPLSVGFFLLVCVGFAVVKYFAH